MDRSFLLNALDQPKSATLARLIVQTAQALGLEVVAEGVETDEQYRFLLGLGCERFQGYRFGKPAPFDSTASPG
jgi:EAL domain-containing protein (putative c-di-GMP-specific phosphodiesterase class I)